MPTPNPNEDELAFVDRCALQLIEDGEADTEDEAVAMCEDLWAEARGDFPNLERRAAPLEISAKGSNGRRLEGYAATFHTEARIGEFVETIAPGAFKMARDILALVDHDATRVLARTRSKTLRLAEDSKGLAFSLDVPRTNYGDDVLELVDRGDIGGMSFGFTVAKNGETWNGDKRTLTGIDLREISVVSAWPAYSGTVVNARAKTIPRPAKSFIRLNHARRYLETLR